MSAGKLLKECWWLILLLTGLAGIVSYKAVFNQASGPGIVSSCIVQSTGPAQGYGPTEQKVTCASVDFGVVIITAPKNKMYAVGQTIQVIGYEHKQHGRSYRVYE